MLKRDDEEDEGRRGQRQVEGKLERGGVVHSVRAGIPKETKER